MSKKHYTNYNNMSNNTPVEESVVSTPIEEVVVETVVEEVVEPEVVPEPEPAKPVYGFVDKCEKLNIRKTPSKLASVLCVLTAKAEVLIDTEKSTNDWYSVRTAAGVEGFCMKNFITIK